MASRARRELTALRLAAQAIARPRFTNPEDVVRWMLGMQGQDYPGVKWSIALRTTEGTEAGVEAALASGAIARAWPFRGTLHVVAPEDLGWMLPIAAERQAAVAARRRADLEITERELEVAADLARELMTGGRSVRRDALLRAWDGAGVPTTGQRGYHLLWNLGMRGVLVFGPTDGRQPSFALLEERVPRPRVLDRDEALAELALRYFRSHGPATVHDLAWWASIPVSWARRGVQSCGAGLEQRSFDGEAYVLAPGLEPAPHGVHLLPGFDEYLLGYQDRSPVLPQPYADRIVPGNNGIFQPTIIAGGQVVGTWRRTESANALTIAPDAFERLTRTAAAGVIRAAKRLGRYAAKPASIAP